MPLHMMVDLETLGSGNDGAIVQIGAVRFDPFVPGYILGEWKQNVSPESSVLHGGQMDPSTVVWWMHQSEEARRSVFPVREERKVQGKNPDAPVDEGIAIDKALRELGRFYRRSRTTWLLSGRSIEQPDPCTSIWAHATFDPVVLASAYRRSSIGLPWSHRDVRDLRTIISLAPKAADRAYREGEQDGPRHDALADALRQVRVVWACFEALNLRKEDDLP